MVIFFLFLDRKTALNVSHCLNQCMAENVMLKMNEPILLFFLHTNIQLPQIKKKEKKKKERNK